MISGRIIKAISGFYYVKVGDTVYECKARGIFKNNGQEPLVGDIVNIDTLSDRTGVVNEILPRKNQLCRPPLANIDKLFIVSSYQIPAPNTLIIDTMCAVAEENGIKPIIVFNKCDMGDFSEYVDIYSKIGYPVYTVSAQNGIGLNELRAQFDGSLCVLCGNTGVGKSSILNALFPFLDLKTGEVSNKLGRGKHTTRHCEIYSVENGGFFADTPGFSSLTLIEAGFYYKENLQFDFPEIYKFSGDCKFTGCSHTNEKGCAVISAVDNGYIPISRFNSYTSLYKELSSLNNWEIDSLKSKK